MYNMPLYLLSHCVDETVDHESGASLLIIRWQTKRGVVKHVTLVVVGVVLIVGAQQLCVTE